VSELPPELRDLIAAERTSPLPTSRIAVRSKLAASVGAAPLGHVASASLVGSAKVLAILAIVAATGTIAALSHSTSSETSRAPAVARVPVSVPVTRAVEPGAPVPPPHVELAAPASPAPPPRLRPSIKKPPPEAVDEAVRAAVAESPRVASEAELLRRAWSASTHDPAQTLALVIEDERFYPDGVLAEERDALRISALAKLDRLDDARVAATRFFVHHPDSVHRAMVERSIGATTETKKEH
jgi:hypothetical protein